MVFQLSAVDTTKYSAAVENFKYERRSVLPLVGEPEIDSSPKDSNVFITASLLLDSSLGFIVENAGVLNWFSIYPQWAPPREAQL